MHIILSGPPACFGPLYFPFVVFICLVAHEDSNQVRACQSSCIGKPPGQICEGIPICYIVNKKCTGSTTIIAAGDGSKTLLTSCIPQLKLYTLFTQFDRAAGKLDANRVL